MLPCKLPVSKNLPQSSGRDEADKTGLGEEQAARMVGAVAGFHLAEERRALWR